MQRALSAGMKYLERKQRPDGSWLPLWFGNQQAPNDENPLYGTARVLMAFRDLELQETDSARRGWQWLVGQQNADGGWGGMLGLPSSVEETALAVDALCTGHPAHAAARDRGLHWLLQRISAGMHTQPSPIGFYFAKLWYFERLYPLVFTVAALRRALDDRSPLTDTFTATGPADALCDARPTICEKL